MQQRERHGTADQPELDFEESLRRVVEAIRAVAAREKAPASATATE